MTVDPYIVDLDADVKSTLKVYLFKNVQNADEIRTNIITGVWECAVVKPSLIIDPFQLAVAANRAVLAEKQNSMVTRTVFAEILFNLSLSKNISQSLSKFGIEKDEELLICCLAKPNDDNSTEIITQINGELCPITELQTFTNLKEIQKVYKLGNTKCSNEMLDIVVSKMVTKSLVSHYIFVLFQNRY